jgi:PAS domain S-box-containing protein
MTLCLEKSETIEISPLREIASFKNMNQCDTFFYGLDLKNDRLFHVSSTSSDVIGYENDHVIGKGLGWFVEQIHPEDLGHLDHLVDKQEKLEIVPHIEYRFKHKNGDYRPIYEHRCLLYDDNGHPSFLIGRIEKN